MIDVAWMLGKHVGRGRLGTLMALARSNHQVLLVKETLQEINALADLPELKELLGQLQKEPISWMDRFEARMLYVYRPLLSFNVRLIRRLLLYRRSIKVPGPLRWPGTYSLLGVG